MNKLQVFNNPEFGQVRTLEENGVVLFCGADVARALGYPDGWTNIPGASDSARYKALGNSIALPPWKWVLKRLCANYERDATMASLFDGIGGYPLLWEQLNGKGSCLWSSEIEAFPMAVTKARFGGQNDKTDII